MAPALPFCPEPRGHPHGEIIAVFLVDQLMEAFFQLAPAALADNALLNEDNDYASFSQSLFVLDRVSPTSGEPRSVKDEKDIVESFLRVSDGSMEVRPFQRGRARDQVDVEIIGVSWRKNTMFLGEADLRVLLHLS